jgi:hypothetical protein
MITKGERKRGGSRKGKESYGWERKGKDDGGSQCTRREKKEKITRETIHTTRRTRLENEPHRSVQ